MKILHILSGKANPNTLNGVNKVVHCIAEVQIKAGFDVTVCGVVNNEKIRHQHKYPLVLFKKGKIKYLPPKRLIRFLQSQNIDTIFHLHSAFIPYFVGLSIYLRLKGFKFVLTPHGAYTPNNFKTNYLKIIYFYLVESIILRLAMKVHFIGASEINTITSRYVKNKAVLVPNGCSYQPIEPKKNNKSELVFGYLGRLKIDHKGLDLLMKGFSLYKEEGGRGILKLVGDGPDIDRLKILSEKYNISNSVFFLGIKFGEDKDNFFKEISFFVHTSRWEGLPTACLEASSFNVPLLVSMETNMGEMINQYKSGYVLEENNQISIKEALLKLESKFYDEDDYIKTKYNVLLMTKNEFLWEVINDKLIEGIYKLDK